MRFRKTLDDIENGLEVLKKKFQLWKRPERIEAFDISNFAGKEATGSVVVFIDGKPDKRYYRRFRIKTVSDIDDYAMMRELVIRRFSKPDDRMGSQPDVVLIDGGKGHLNAAVETIRKMGVRGITCAGIAKRLEAVYVYGEPDPLLFESDSPGLNMLRHIRDEAHRFAIAFHRKLRQKRIAESILDDIPGIGNEKKRALMLTFGSVRRLKEASPDEISTVPGVGALLANQIYAHLKACKKKRNRL